MFSINCIWYFEALPWEACLEYIQEAWCVCCHRNQQILLLRNFGINSLLHRYPVETKQVEIKGSTYFPWSFHFLLLLEIHWLLISFLHILHKLPSQIKGIPWVWVALTGRYLYLPLSRRLSLPHPAMLLLYLFFYCLHISY